MDIWKVKKRQYKSAHMKKIVWLIVLIILGNLEILAQSWTASNMISTSGSFTEITAKLSLEGDILAYGYFNGTLFSSDGISTRSNGKRDYYLIKFLPDGNVDWMKNFGSTSSEYTTGGMTLDSLSNIYISGGFQGSIKISETDSILSQGAHDMFLMKIDTAGEILWAKNAGTGQTLQAATALEIDPSGDLILAGIFQDSIQIYNQETLYAENNVSDYFYGKFDTTAGDLEWIKQAKSLHKLGGSIEHILTTSHSYLFTGNYYDSIGFESDTIISFNDEADIQLISTDIDGNISWINRIRGARGEYSQSLVEENEGNVYISGSFESDTLLVDSRNQIPIEIPGSNGSRDIFIAKYNAFGALEWFQTAGGKGEEDTYNMEMVNGKILVSGHFSDTLNWGASQLVSSGLKDIDMFVGEIYTDGRFIDARQYNGNGLSNDQSRGVFHSTDRTFNLMRTNSDTIVIGDDIYDSDGASYILILGIIECQRISIDKVTTLDVSTCFGDSTGSIHVYVTGGYGEPYQYSFDNGITYVDDAYLDNLSVGDYKIVVSDKENCSQSGNMETINQPEPLMVELVSSSGTTSEMDGEIVVAASGGSAPYIYTLQPGGVDQSVGTFSIAPGEEGLYLVEVTDAQNCGPVSTDTIGIFVLSDGLDLSEYGVKLYPNPTSGVITLEMPFNGAEATLEVLSLMGQVMMSHQVYSAGGVINETVDLSNLSKGMYMIRVEGQTLRSGVVVN